MVVVGEDGLTMRHTSGVGQYTVVPNHLFMIFSEYLTIILKMLIICGHVQSILQVLLLQTIFASCNFVGLYAMQRESRFSLSFVNSNFRGLALQKDLRFNGLECERIRRPWACQF